MTQARGTLSTAHVSLWRVGDSPQDRCSAVAGRMGELGYARWAQELRLAGHGGDAVQVPLTLLGEMLHVLADQGIRCGDKI